jgi:predicted permease
MERLRTQPDVEAAAAIFGMPLTNFNYVISMSTIDSQRITDDAEQNRRSLEVRVVTPEYFRAMGIPVRRGRALTAADRLGVDPSVLVNETAARLLWPGADPIGHAFTLGTRMGQGGLPAGGTVVGVAGDVYDFGPQRRVRPAVYLSHAQFPVSFMTVVIKARRDAGAVVKPARAELDEIDPNLPMFQMRSAEQLAANAVAQPRLYLLLMGMFASAAVLLAAIGIYGVLAHTVSQRTREIGIRLALGASRALVVRQIVGQAGRLAAIGLAIGILLSMATGRFIRELLFGIEPVDVVTYALVAVGLGVIAVAASLLPARRASRVDPIVALRSE